MEVKQLFTLSRFVEYLYNEHPVKEGALLNAEKAERFDMIVNHMQFSKQQLTEEMFVNLVEYPIGMYYRPDEGVQKYPQECYKHDMSKWIEAENKVIFDTVSIENYFEMTIYDFVHPTKSPFNNISIKDFKSINDLAEATKEELKLKNVTV